MAFFSPAVKLQALAAQDISAIALGVDLYHIAVNAYVDVRFLNIGARQPGCIGALDDAFPRQLFPWCRNGIAARLVRGGAGIRSGRDMALLYTAQVDCRLTVPADEARCYGRLAKEVLVKAGLPLPAPSICFWSTVTPIFRPCFYFPGS